MSFTTDVKDELSRVEPECQTCAKAMLSALVKSQGTLKLIGAGKYSIEFVTDNAWIARFALSKFRELYNLDAVLTFRRSVLHNTRNFLIELLQGQKLLDALLDMGILNLVNDKDKKAYYNIANGIKDEFMKKSCCSAAYLRGAFLGSGYTSDPKKDFHFEISAERKKQAQDIQKILKKKDIKGGVCKRRNNYLFYIKSGQGIADFLAFTGAHKSALMLENIRVYKHTANRVNRLTNADIANSKRSVDAAYNQLLTISKVAHHYGLENLSPALREFMALRIKYREVSLSQLGKYANPPLSKSALNGRVRRLEQMAKEINS